ncbi:MAG: ATP-binding protein [Candidatus ainarchaeum sp.]|nr:ATP-binding protein [Candidatus ainarchaeum sp.]
MDEKQLGTVVSNFDGPSPSRVDFVINNGMIHKGMFVEIPYSQGNMICMVEDLIKTNRYFERPDSVKTIGSEMENHFPVADWEFLIAKTRPLGIFSENKQIQRPTFPPSPGTKVFIAEGENIKRFLGIDEKGLMLGEIPFHNVNLKPKLSKLLQKHLAILATSGAGKSFLTSVIIEEILQRQKEDGQIALLLFDVHNEYSFFGEGVTDNKYTDYSSKTKIINGKDIKFKCSSITPSVLSSIFPKITHIQKREILNIINKLKQEMKSGAGPFDLNKIKNEVLNLDEKTANPLIAMLNEVEQLNLFEKIEKPSIYDFLKQGQLTIINLNDIMDERKKQIIVALVSRKLFNLRQDNYSKIPPFTLIVEEAHNFIPESTAGERAIAREPLTTIAREGRKFGASLVVISQRPKRLSSSILANCNTQIILRITNPYDLDHIKQTSEGLDSTSINMIPSLKVGDALIVGEAVNAPTFFKVRLKKSQNSKHEFTLEDLAKRFNEKEEIVNKDTEAYL